MFTFELADLVSRLNVASKGHITSVMIRRSQFSIDILSILYKNGVIRGFNINNDIVKVYLKYHKNQPLFKELKIISTPGRRVYWTLNWLVNKYNNNAFSGFYIISTHKGLITSNSALLTLPLSGEILLKVSI